MFWSQLICTFDFRRALIRWHELISWFTFGEAITQHLNCKFVLCCSGVKKDFCALCWIHSQVKVTLSFRSSTNRTHRRVVLRKREDWQQQIHSQWLSTIMWVAKSWTCEMQMWYKVVFDQKMLNMGSRAAVVSFTWRRRLDHDKFLIRLVLHDSTAGIVFSSFVWFRVQKVAKKKAVEVVEGRKVSWCTK